MELKLLLLSLTALCLTAVTSPQHSCGQRPLVSPPGASRVVGGREARVGAWPWQVSIQIQSRHHCGGTIISSLWVLTSTHCFYKYQRFRKHFRVVAGLNVLSPREDNAQIRSINQFKMHEGYNEITWDSDMMLLLLNSPFNFTDRIQPVCSPHNVSHEFLLNFSHCFITGWGSNSFKGRMLNRLQEAEVELIDRRRCNSITWYAGSVTENMVCAGLESGAADSCQGDSGGPLQCYSEDEERFYIVGVTSFGQGCGRPHKPGVYTRTSRFAGWLKTNQVASESATHRHNIRLISALLIAVLTLL